MANAMRKLKRRVESRKTRFRIKPEAARHSIMLIGRKCDGGAIFNLVPNQCSFTIDRRINPEEDFEAEKRLLLIELDRMRRNGIDLELEIFQEANPAKASEGAPLAKALARNVKEISGKRAAFEMCPGVLETRFYAQRGIPAFAYGSGSLLSSHGPNESVRISDVYRCAAVYALTALSVLSARRHRNQSLGHDLEESEG